MAELISKLGVDWKLLIAQIINFLVLLVILYRFFYRPILGMMQKRTKRIEDGLKKAKEIEDELVKTQADYRIEISRAKKEANEILEKANVQAEKNKKEMVVKAKEEIAQVINREKKKIAAEKEQTVKEIKAEIADLVTASVEKILEERVEK